MPDDIAVRLEAALQSLSPAPAASHPSPGQGPSGPGPSGQGPSGQRPPDRRPGAGSRAPAPARDRAAAGPPGRAARRRRRTRWGAALAGLAGVVAFAAIGLGPLGLADSLTGGAEDGAAGGDAAADAPAAASDEDTAETLEGPPGQAVPEDGADGATLPKAASGRDYVPGSPLLARNLVPDAPVAPRAEQERPDEPLPIDGTVPEELAPLWAEPDPCLRAVADDYRPARVTIELVDFARFEGDPAVVIWLTAEDRPEVLVAGPDCGKPAAGLDERYRAELD